MKPGQLYTSPSNYLTFYSTQELAVKSGADTYGYLQYSDSHRAAAEDTCVRFYDRHGAKIHYISPKTIFLTVQKYEQNAKMQNFEFWQIIAGEHIGWIVFHPGPNYDYIVRVNKDK